LSVILRWHPDHEDERCRTAGEKQIPLCSLRSRFGMTGSRKQGKGSPSEGIRGYTGGYCAGMASLACSECVLSLPRSSTAVTEYQYILPAVTLVSRKAGVFTNSVLIFAG